MNVNLIFDLFPGAYALVYCAVDSIITLTVCYALHKEYGGWWDS